MARRLISFRLDIYVTLLRAAHVTRFWISAFFFEPDSGRRTIIRIPPIVAKTNSSARTSGIAHGARMASTVFLVHLCFSTGRTAHFTPSSTRLLLLSILVRSSPAWAAHIGPTQDGRGVEAPFAHGATSFPVGGSATAACSFYLLDGTLQRSRSLVNWCLYLSTSTDAEINSGWGGLGYAQCSTSFNIR